MKTLVTGMTGFIGGNLTKKLLDEGHEVSGLIQPIIGRDFRAIKDIKEKVTLLTCDIKNYSSVRNTLEKINPDVVFHLAALSPVRMSFEHPLGYQETNFIGTVNITEALRNLYGPDKTRLITASTAEVYGIQPENKPFKEDMRLEPSSPYAVSKGGIDMYLRMLNKVYDSNVVILRNSNTFGRTHDKSFFTEYLITQMLDGKEIYIGAPNSIRDYMYVEDHVNGYNLAMKTPEAKGEVFNIGGGKGYTNREWTLTIANILDFPKKKIHLGEYPPGYPYRPLTSDQPYLVLNTSKAKKILGWEQTISPEEGLRKTINYWKSVV